MNIILKYKRASYLESLETQTLTLKWEQGDVAVKSALNQFFDKKHIAISLLEMQEIIKEVECAGIDGDFTVRVVIQKGDFDKSLQSIKSGVTVKLVFLLREMVADKAHWYVYGLGSGLFNNRSILNITKERKLGYTTYLSLSEKDDSASKSVPSTIERLRERIANKAIHATSA